MTDRIFLFFDTETTGLIDRKKKLDDPSQPHIVQLAAVLCDEAGTHLEELNLIAKPDGWMVPEVCTNIHGLTTEICEERGIPMLEILTRFNAMKAKCTDRVAFNIPFDKQMLLREEMAYGIPHDEDKKISLCVMKMSEPICKMPATAKQKEWNIGPYKAPKLIEAYRHFFSEDFDRAHDAMNDVMATKRIFFHIGEMQNWINPQAPEELTANQGAA
jgi:DNA polymerase-3 subunit epsilon